MHRNDWRLQFVNLKNDTSRKNIIGKQERDKIWIPNLVFDNSVKDIQIENDAFSTLVINQNGNATRDMNAYFQDDEKYNGTENSLVYLRNYKIKLLCDFDQHYFPFDCQTCTIKVIICLILVKNFYR
jgi:hypothetical protein